MAELSARLSRLGAEVIEYPSIQIKPRPFSLEIREALSLRSACFTVKFAEDTFTFTVKGFGHGVGLSQYGADYMARQGADYKEILTHYYTGVTIE